MLRLLFIATIALLSQPASGQVTETFGASKDNSLYESNTGSLSNGAGNKLFTGRTQNRGLRRALIAFDVSSIPPGSDISEVDIQVSVDRTIAGPISFNVHPVSADWGEGTSNASGQEGGGGTASAGDATWIHRFSPDQAWNQAGGDFGAVVTSASLAGNGRYTFPSSDELVALVQSWVDDPSSNFGVIIIGEGAAGTTAKRLISRESGTNGPALNVTYNEGASSGPPPGVAGLWFDPNAPGDGYNVIQSEDGLTVFFFGYTSSGERLWLVTDTSTDAIAFGMPITITVFVGAGGSFDDPTTAGLMEWGTLTVTFIDCQTAQFELMGLDGSKAASNARLQGVSGNTCEDPN